MNTFFLFHTKDVDSDHLSGPAVMPWGPSKVRRPSNVELVTLTTLSKWSGANSAAHFSVTGQKESTSSVFLSRRTSPGMSVPALVQLPFVRMSERSKLNSYFLSDYSELAQSKIIIELSLCNY